MATIQRLESNDRVRKKVQACKDAGYKVSQNYIAGVTVVEYNGQEVLRCTRKEDNVWLMDYNDEFWDEIPREEPPQTPETPAK